MTPNQPTTSFLQLFARIFWMMIGPLTLAILAYAIVNVGSGWLTVADIAFFLVLGGVVLARWIEFQGGNPQKATGEPATPADLHRFVVVTLILGLVVWVIANLIGNHWF